MIWANALVLGLGGVLLTLPVILHFLMQPKPKVLEFPALRFVKKRQMSNKSRMRLRHVVLLILRCLVILLMAAALAGPSVASREFGQWVTLGGVGISTMVVALALSTVLWGSETRHRLLLGLLAVLLVGHLGYLGWATTKLLNSNTTQLIGNSAAPVSAVLLVDNSFRMDYKRENQTNLERAKEMGRWLIEQFPSDSQTCVLSGNDDVPFFSVDLGAARNRVDNMEIVFSRVSLPDRIAEGIRLLDEAENERKEIYVLTDLASKSWTASNSTLLQQLQAEPTLSVFILDVGSTDLTNYSISPPTLNRSSVTRTSGINIGATVSQLGKLGERNVRLRLEKQDKTKPVIRDRQVVVTDQYIERTRIVGAAANGAEEIEFRYSEPLEHGIYHGVLEIAGGDALTHDDRRYFTVEVRSPWQMLVIHGENVTPDNLTEAIVDQGDDSLFQCTVIPQSEMPTNFAPYQAVVLLDPDPGIAETTWGILEQYVSSGHGLGIFLGANAADGGLGHASFQGKKAQKLLTGRLDRQWRRTDDSLFLSPNNLSHPIFRPFRSWETAVRWNQFPVYLHWSLSPDDRWQTIPTKSILPYGNGKPAIIERSIGEGTVLVMTTPITESAQIEDRAPWNHLFIGNAIPAWLLVRQISEYLMQSQQDRLNLNVGEFVTLKNDSRLYPNEYQVFTPRTSSSTEKVTAKDETLKYRFTQTPGHYRLRGKLAETVLRGVSVNIADGEADLSRILPAELDKILGAQRYQLATQRDQIQRQQGATRRGQEFYPLLLLMLVIVLGVEYLLSTRFYK